MTTPFATLQIPARPWLSPEEVQASFFSLASRWHPDGNSDPSCTAEFQKINSAHQILRDPVRRLEAVLEIESPGMLAGLSKNTLPSSLPELFMELATLQREVAAFCAQHESTQSPLGLALLNGEVVSFRKDLERISQKLQHHWERCLSQVQAVDSIWERRTPELLNTLATVHQEMVYLQRWMTQLKESRLKIESLQKSLPEAAPRQTGG